MLFETFKNEGLLSIVSVLGATSQGNTFSFRGDLVLQEGQLIEGSERDRKPPVSVIHQATALAGSDRLLFVSGLVNRLEDLSLFVNKYRQWLSSETVLIMYVEDIAETMTMTLDACTFHLLPYPGGMIWNELLDDLYLEKSDLKGQSAEDKVMTLYDAARSFDTKTAPVRFEDAMDKVIEVVKDVSVGPV